MQEGGGGCEVYGMCVGRQGRLWRIDLEGTDDGMQGGGSAKAKAKAVTGGGWWTDGWRGRAVQPRRCDRSMDECEDEDERTKGRARGGDMRKR